MFTDPFFNGFGKASAVNDTRFHNYSGDYARGRTYDAAQDGTVQNFLELSAELGAKNSWHLRSRGPDNDYEARSSGWADYIRFRGQRGTGANGDGGIAAQYDPTNGTASGGDIARFGREGIPN